MSLTRKFAATAAVAFVATMGFGATATGASADTDGEFYGHDDSSLVSVDDNNVGPFQVCNNNVPTNVLGVQVPVSDLAGFLGFDNDGNAASNVKNCDQDSLQDN